MQASYAEAQHALKVELARRKNHEVEARSGIIRLEVGHCSKL